MLAKLGNSFKQQTRLVTTGIQSRPDTSPIIPARRFRQLDRWLGLPMGLLIPEMDIAKLCTVPSTSPSLARILNVDDDSVTFDNSMTDEPLFQSP
jgi:hypothetical protein